VSLESDMDILKRVPFFEGFTGDHLRLIAFSAESRSLPERLLLYDEGQLMHSAYVLVSGTMSGERKPRAGQPAAKRAIEAGAILGERALILDTRASESVRVGEKARVLQIRKAMFRRLLEEYPEIALAIRTRLSRSVIQGAAEFSRWTRKLNPGDV
jgi:CRP-like cAMP-binding protein